MNVIVSDEYGWAEFNQSVGMKHHIPLMHVLTHLSALPPTTDKLCVDCIKDSIQLSIGAEVLMDAFIMHRP